MILFFFITCEVFDGVINFIFYIYESVFGECGSHSIEFFGIKEFKGKAFSVFAKANNFSITIFNHQRF